MELFLYGNPRFLSGCSGKIAESRNSYETRISGRRAGHGFTTSDLENLRTSPDDTAELLMERAGISLHRGKGGYHATPVYNNFLVEGQWPSAGIELETIMSVKSADNARKADADLVSNWFHFERDGSLDCEHHGEYGYELITEPLPPRVYRDPRTWNGLENVIAPWLESFDHSDTGLHVHVGLNQFAEFDGIPLPNALSRVYIGKYMSLLVYYVLAGSSLVDRVTLRKNTGYCGALSNQAVFSGTRLLESGRMTGAQFVDHAVSKLCMMDACAWNRLLSESCPDECCESTRSHNPGFCQIVPSGTSSHSTEVNCDHRYTIEFRRGKGTCHALSIHRMVELMTGIVRYAGKCCREPDMEVSRESFLDFMARTTTSEVLRKMITEKGN